MSTEASGAGIVAGDEPVPYFFPVSPAKLVVMTLATLGLYQVYWGYQNWRRIHDRGESDIVPAVWAFFAFFTAYGLFRRVRDAQEELDPPARLLAGPLAVAWIVFSLLWRLPEPYLLLGFFAVGFLVPVQRAINRINAAVAPGHGLNAGFSVLNWVVIVVGGLATVLLIAGVLLVPVRAGAR